MASVVVYSATKILELLAQTVVNATKTVRGIVELATTAEVLAGLDDERAVTPLGVQTAIAAIAELRSGTVQAVTLTGAAQAITLPEAPATGEILTLVLTQDATGGRTAAWPDSVTWDGNTSPTLTTTPGGRDVVTFLRTAGDWLGFISGTFAAYDETPPSVPAGLAATPLGASSIELSWAASTDNLGVAGYEYRINGGAAIDAGAGTTETIVGLSASTAYTFQIRAYDAAGNRSGWSTAATATTDAFTNFLEAAVMALSPLGYWKLDETSGTVAEDSSAHGRDGTYAGAYALAGRDGFATFSGGYVQIADADEFTTSTASGLTIFALVYMNATVAARQFIAAKGAADAYEWHIEVPTETTDLTAEIFSDIGYVVTGRRATGAITAANWRAVAVALPSGLIRGANVPLYVNSGTALSTTVNPDNDGSTVNAGAPVRLAGRADGVGPWGGALAHVAIFPGQLTGTQIGDLISAARTEGLIP